MRILINDFAGHAFQLELSRALARAGHSVLHTYFSDNDTPKGATDVVADDLVVEGIGTGRKFHKHSILSRRSADISYGQAIQNRLTVFRPEIVLSANTPLDAQRLILKATQECGGRFVFWLQDVLSTGIEFVLRKKHIPFSRVAGLWYRRLERDLLGKSDAIVCIAPEFCTTIQQWQVPLEKTFVIENWAPLDEVSPLPRETSWAAEHGLHGKFCFMYSGTLGMKHNPELLLDLARHYESRNDVAVVVIAEGAGAEWLRSQQCRVRAGALRVLPFQPYERLSEVLASSDVLITLLDNECGAFAVPSKALTYMCAGRPILVAAPQDNLVTKMVKRAGVGLTVQNDLGEFLRSATLLLNDVKGRERYGRRARLYAETTFRIDRIRDEFVKVFEYARGTGEVRARLADAVLVNQ